MAWIITIPFFVAFFFFGRAMIGIFVDSSSSALTIETGRMFLFVIAPFYFVISIKIVVEGVIKGAGAMKAFMASTFSDLIIRVVLSRGDAVRDPVRDRPRFSGAGTCPHHYRAPQSRGHAPLFRIQEFE